jgi:putative alpha-1,2-mannosidase
VQVGEVGEEQLYVRGHMLNHGALSGRLGGIDVFFHATFRGGSVDPMRTGVWDNGVLRLLATSGRAPMKASGNVSAFAGLNTGMDDSPAAGHAAATAVVGVSCISLEQARLNAEVQVGTKTFDALVEEAYAEWDDRLGVVTLEPINVSRRHETGAERPEDDLTADDDRLQIAFWTALYHTLISPSTYSESGGRYLAFDRANAPPFPIKTLLLPGDRHLSDMSIWDTHR